jgi:hypothetical protein
MSREMPKRRQKLDKQKEQNLFRVNSFRQVKQTFLIICEGKNTEPDYFNAFRLSSANVKALGEGYNTLSLVRRALEIKQKEQIKGKIYNQYWVVFDKDDFSAKDFNDAIQLAQSGGFQVAYSNQAFEYWFLLHFNLYQGEIHRTTYEKTLTSLLGFAYKKDTGVTTRMFNALISRQKIAIAYAKTVYDSFEGNHSSPAMEESSTTVFRLVEELNKYL